MFINMIDTVKQATVSTLFRVQLAQEEDLEAIEEQEEQRRKKQAMQMNRGGEAETRKPITRDGEKIGRNAPCPCGSGKKYKRCCGQKQ